MIQNCQSASIFLARYNIRNSSKANTQSVSTKRLSSNKRLQNRILVRSTSALVSVAVNITQN